MISCSIFYCKIWGLTWRCHPLNHTSTMWCFDGDPQQPFKVKRTWGSTSLPSLSGRENNTLIIFMKVVVRLCYGFDLLTVIKVGATIFYKSWGNHFWWKLGRQGWDQEEDKSEGFELWTLSSGLWVLLVLKGKGGPCSIWMMMMMIVVDDCDNGGDG